MFKRFFYTFLILSLFLNNASANSGYEGIIRLPNMLKEERIIKDDTASFIKANTVKTKIYTPELIEDDTISPLKKENIKKTKPYTPQLIEDEYIKDLKNINISVPKTENKIIEDEVVKEKFRGRVIYKQKFVELPTIEDNYLTVSKEQNLKKNVYNPKIINENSEEIKIKVSSPIAFVSSIVPKESKRSKVYLYKENIGDKVSFIIDEDIEKDNKLFIRKGTKAEGTIGNITPPVSGGGGAEMIFEKFYTYDVDGNRIYLNGQIIIKGFNTSFIQYLLAYGGMPFTFGASVFILYSPGGAATLKSHKSFTLIYEEEEF